MPMEDRTVSDKSPVCVQGLRQMLVEMHALDLGQLRVDIHQRFLLVHNSHDSIEKAAAETAAFVPPSPPYTRYRAIPRTWRPSGTSSPCMENFGGKADHAGGFRHAGRH